MRGKLVIRNINNRNGSGFGGLKAISASALYLSGDRGMAGLQEWVFDCLELTDTRRVTEGRLKFPAECSVSQT